MRIAFLDGDLVTGVVDGASMAGPEIPAALAVLPVARLRFNGAAIIDAAGVTNWHIDALGRKHIPAAEDRQPLSCAWDAALINEDGAWRVKTLADDLMAYAAQKRWTVETGGLTLNYGARIATDRQSQAMIAGAHAYAQANPETTIAYKAETGFVTLDAAAVLAIANAVGAHVQACFATEAMVAAAIASGAITSTAQIDAADWPANN